VKLVTKTGCRKKDLVHFLTSIGLKRLLCMPTLPPKSYAWQKRPNDPTTYPPPWNTYLADFKRLFDLWLKQESESLTQLGIPIPQMTSECSFVPVYETPRPPDPPKPSPKTFGDFFRELFFPPAPPPPPPEPVISRVEVTLPSFQIPPNLFFPFWLRKLQTSDRNSLGQLNNVESQNRSGHSGCTEKSQFFIAGYFIVAPESRFQTILTTFKDSGLVGVVEQYKGIWVSRHPYAFFTTLQSHNLIKTFSVVHEEKGDFFSHPNFIYGYHPQKGIPQHIRDLLFTPSPVFPLHLLEELEQDGISVIRRANFFLDIIDDQLLDEDKVRSSELYMLLPLPNNIPESIYRDLPLPPAPPPLRNIETVLELNGPPPPPRVVAQFLESIRSATGHIHFSIVGTRDTIKFFIHCTCKDEPLITKQLSLCFPDMTVIRCESTLYFETSSNGISAYPHLHTQYSKLLSKFAIDPYKQLISIFDQVTAEGEQVSFVVSFAPLSRIFYDILFDALRKLIATYSKLYIETQNLLGHSLNMSFHNLSSFIHDSLAPPAAERLEKKQSAWLVNISVTSTTPQLLESLSLFFNQYETDIQRWHVSSAEYGQQERLMTTDELVSLVHFPSKDVTSPKLQSSAKSQPPPPLYTTDGVRLGTNTHRGTSTPAVLPQSVRDRHLYIVGKTRTGKSTLLSNLALQDIMRGEGVAVIDPHGDLVEGLLDYIPKDRIEDCIYFDATDTQHLVGLNVLNATTDEEIGRLADDLIVTFHRLSESWGERMAHILRFTFHTLLRVPDATFLDVYSLLTDDEYRNRCISRIRLPFILDFWRTQFPTLPKDALQPILSRMSKFMLSPSVYGILSQARSPLNFYDVIQSKKILLVNLADGKIGQESAHLLGSLIVSQFQLATMRRAAIPKEQRDFYYLYIDEFQNFTTSAFDKILSEAGKYRLSLTLAHQYINQLDDAIKHAILGNVGTMVVFPIALADATTLRGELGGFSPEDVTNLDTALHEALCRPATRSTDAFKMTTLPPPPSTVSFAPQVIAYTRATYSTDTSEPIPEPVHNGTPPDKKPPRRAAPKEFSTAQEKVLYLVSRASYLSTQQIIGLCYSHIAESAQAQAAHRDLKQLVTEKKIKVQPFGRGNVYTTERTCNPTAHNLGVRDVYVRIMQSAYEVTEVNFFFSNIPTLTPDLYVSFAADEGDSIHTFWEYDTGTEGIAEIIKKVNRYQSYPYDFLTFVVVQRERLEVLKKALTGRVRFVILDEFTSLSADVFFDPESSDPTPFFLS
jgi:hypothetical protein